MSFTETLQSITGKLLADCTDQELYLALLELVRQKSADRVQPVTGRKLYYISAEFLIGKLLSNNLINLGVVRRSPGCTGRCRKAPFGHRGGGAGAFSRQRRSGPSGSLLPGFAGNAEPARATAWGLRYHFGLFHQSFEDGVQNESPTRGSPPTAGLKRPM